MEKTQNFMRRPLAVVDDDETFPNAWLTEENETVEMAALVLWHLRNDMMDVCGSQRHFHILFC